MLLSYKHDNVCQPEYHSYQHQRKYTFYQKWFYLYCPTIPDYYNHDNATPVVLMSAEFKNIQLIVPVLTKLDQRFRC